MSSGDNPQPDLSGTEAPKRSTNGKASGDLARHASVTELELAFAQNPESSAYADLCRAYLEQGRFMEAMVVCKKGIKAHPDSVEARVLLAQIYGAQKKYQKGLKELDDLAQSRPDTAEVHLARGKMRLESNDTGGAIADLKRAIDLAPDLDEAKRILKAKGIEYPEKRPEPPPPPALAAPVPGMSPPAYVAVAPFPQSMGSVSPGSAPQLGAPQAITPEGAVIVPYIVHPSGAIAPVIYPPRQQRLEGEEELEQLAKAVAVERPAKGKAVTSIRLAIALVVLGLGTVIYLFAHKNRIEQMDRLTTEGMIAFNQDTYGSYKTAAGYFEEILQRYDSSHPLTLGRLAHCYAILWGEHGDQLKPKLDEVLARAVKKAPDVSHTVAARGLAVLYDGRDRQANAAKAKELLAPIVQRVKEVDGAPSYADLTLAIADLELGNYDTATEVLGNVKNVIRGSVRAKVWHARAAFRASRFATAEAAFQEALRAAPGHPGARAGLALVKVVRGDLNGAAENLLRFDELPEKETSRRDRALAEFARSEVLRAAGETQKATVAYDRASQDDKDNADFPYGLGRSLLENEHAKEALPHLKKAVEMEKTRWSFLIALAEAEMRLDDYRAAQQHVEEAIRRAPTFVEAALAKARLLRRTNSPETEPYLKKMLEQWPTSEAEIDLELGRYYRALGKLDDAKAMLEKSIDKMAGRPPAKQAEIVLSYGRLLDDRKETELAAKSYKKAAELGSLESWFRLATSLSHGNKDEKAEAKRACERYLAAGTSLPFSDQARKLCDQIR